MTKAMGGISKETVLLHQQGVFQDNLVLSTEFILLIGHYKEYPKLMFQALLLCKST